MALILLIVDRTTTGEALCGILEGDGHTCEVAQSRQTGMRRARASQPDVAIVDMTSTRFDGSDLCAAFRRTCEIPIVALAERRNEEASAVDYWLIHPYTPQQLLAVIDDVLPRTSALTIGAITLDLHDNTVTNSDEEQLHLTPKEFRLLRLLMQNAGSVVTRVEIMNDVWETNYTADTRTLDVHIRWLREKIEPEPSRPVYIETIRGTGYRFVAPDEAPQ